MSEMPNPSHDSNSSDENTESTSSSDTEGEAFDTVSMSDVSFSTVQKDGQPLEDVMVRRAARQQRNLKRYQKRNKRSQSLILGVAKNAAKLENKLMTTTKDKNINKLVKAMISYEESLEKLSKHVASGKAPKLHKPIPIGVIRAIDDNYTPNQWIQTCVLNEYDIEAQKRDAQINILQKFNDALQSNLSNLSTPAVAESAQTPNGQTNL